MSEIGKEEFYYPLLYYNGHGIKDHFYIYRNSLAVGRVLLSTTFDAYAPGEFEPEPDPRSLYPKDSLLMDEGGEGENIDSVSKRHKKKKKKSPSKPAEKPQWNDRFWVDSMVNFDRSHPFYKVSLDKSQ